MLSTIKEYGRKIHLIAYPEYGSIDQAVNVGRSPIVGHSYTLLMKR